MQSGQFCNFFSDRRLNFIGFLRYGDAKTDIYFNFNENTLMFAILFNMDSSYSFKTVSAKNIIDKISRYRRNTFNIG